MQTVTPTTLPAALFDAAQRFAEKTAVVDGQTRLSFGALQEAALRAAAAFLRAGAGHGQHIAIWAPNSADWIIACLGAQIAGAAIVPLNTRLKGQEAAYILNRSRAHTLITAGRFLGINHAGLLDGQDLPHLRRIIQFDTDWARFLATGADPTAARRAASTITADHPSDIMFTSGTTGHPKGVIATHGQTTRTFGVWAQRVGLHENDRYLIINPFFHSFGYKAGWLACLLTGATAYPMPTLDVTQAAAIVEREKITILPGPPTLFIALLQDPALRHAEWRSLASLRVAVTGAATISPELITRMRNDLRIPTVLTGYGLTESCGVVTMSDAHDDAQTIASSCGRAIPGVEVRIAAASAHEPGEILVRGYNVMQGYFEDNAATAKAIDSEGWLHTGDVGVLDANGYLRITDRLTDMYVSGGFNCYPAEIERLLALHPDIAQVAVIGVPHERLGETGMAFVVPRTGTSPEPEALTAWARGEISNYKVPQIIKIVPSLPQNASGKVLKQILRNSALQITAQDREPTQTCPSPNC